MASGVRLLGSGEDDDDDGCLITVRNANENLGQCSETPAVEDTREARSIRTRPSCMRASLCSETGKPKVRVLFDVLYSKRTCCAYQRASSALGSLSRSKNSLTDCMVRVLRRCSARYLCPRRQVA